MKWFSCNLFGDVSRKAELFDLDITYQWKIAGGSLWHLEVDNIYLHICQYMRTLKVDIYMFIKICNCHHSIGPICFSMRRPSKSPPGLCSWCPTSTATERSWWWEKKGDNFLVHKLWVPTFLFPCKEFSLECSTAMMKYSSGIAWEKRPLSIVQVFFHGGVLFSNGSTLTFRCFGTGLNCSKWIRVDFFLNLLMLCQRTLPYAGTSSCSGNLRRCWPHYMWGFLFSYVHVYLCHCMVR